MADEESSKKGESTDLAKVEVLTAEVVEAAKQLNTGQIQINVLLQQIIQKAPSTEEMVKQSKAMIELAEHDAQARVRVFRETAAAVIEAKNNDPDEKAKRADNKLRRCLKVVLASSMVLCLAGGIASVIGGGSVVLSGLLLVIGAVGLAMLGPLASGETLSTSDVVQLVNAVKGLVPNNRQDPQQQSQPKRRR